MQPNDPYSFVMPTAAPRSWNYLDTLPELSAPLEVPYSPVAANSVLPTSGAPTATVPGFNNPWAYTSWNKAGGLGNYLGANAPLFLGGLQALSGAVGAYTGLKGLSLAKDAFKQQKKEFNINLSNQTQSYNTQMADRINGRSYATEAEREAAMAAALLTDRSTYGKGG